jgi:hypothetical protein
MKDNFIWDDGYVEMILQAATGNIKDFVMQPKQFIQDFKENWKQSHSQASLDWEIVAYKCPFFGENDIIIHKDVGNVWRAVNGRYSGEEASHDEDEINKVGTIYKVRRLSDNEVFSVGDDTIHGKVLSFEIIDKSMYVECKERNNKGHFPLISLPKPKSIHTKDRIEVTIIGNGMAGWATSVRPNNSLHSIPKSKHPAIKEAIEHILNDDPKYKIVEYSHTQQQVDELCEAAFNFSRDKVYNYDHTCKGYRFGNFQDYQHYVENSKIAYEKAKQRTNI